MSEVWECPPLFQTVDISGYYSRLLLSKVGEFFAEKAEKMVEFQNELLYLRVN